MNFGNSGAPPGSRYEERPGSGPAFWKVAKISTRLGAGGLEFGVGVRADFAVQIDFFVLRGGPFHE
jgi:hypothetical protein